MRDEGFQQRELAGGQAHRPPVDLYPPFQQVDGYAGGLEQHGGRAGAPGPQVGPDASQEFLERERFRQVIIRAEVEPLDAVADLSPGAQDQDGDRRPASPQ